MLSHGNLKFSNLVNLLMNNTNLYTNLSYYNKKFFNGINISSYFKL